MAATIFNLDAANLFVGDDDPGNSQFLVLQNIKLPALEETVKSWNPAGGVGAIEMGMRRINALSIPFTLTGINPDVMNRFMVGRRINYTIRANIADVTNQKDIPLIAVVQARMTKVDMGQFTKDDGMNTDYELREIIKYKLTIDGNEKHYVDLLQGPRGYRIDGVEIFREVARNIGLI